MTRGKVTLRAIFCAIVPIMLLLSACSSSGASFSPTITQESGVSVDPLFREFYEMLGGKDIIGPAISPTFSFANHTYQYTDKACMEYNPSAEEGEKFRLAALGLDLNLDDPPVAPPDEQNKVYINGHVVHDAFLSTFRNLGTKYAGFPLSEVHYNAEKKRYEQYFANLGFYWNETDPPEEVKLLSYGAWKCDVHCRYTPPLESRIDLPTVLSSPSDEIFRQAVARLGSNLTGFDLSSPYTGDDGKIEKIYENIVLSYDPSSPGAIFLRPISEKVGVLPQHLVTASTMNGMVFWPIEGDKGHNVPQPFIDYMAAHGGVEVFGAPLGEVVLNQDQVFRQCFTNLCLDYHMRTNVPHSLRIRPAALGYMYQDIQERSKNKQGVSNQLSSVTLQVWEKFQYISYDEYQEIGAAVFDGNTPLAEVIPLLVVTFPDGSQGSFYFPPTDLSGITFYRLDPINAEKGTIVPYQVCVSILTEELFCMKDSYVIWYNP